MNIRIAAAQYPITAHLNLEAWQTHTRRWVADAADRGAQLLVFPEYASLELVSIMPTAMQADIRAQILAMDALKDEFCHTYIALAAEYNLTIVAPSLPVMDGNKPVNRAFVCTPRGIAGYQDKFFMTRFEDEDWGIEAARPQLTIFEADWGSFGIQICYDVEFSIGSRLLCAHGADVILVPSCTETIRGCTRVHVGSRARALENQAWLVVSQTVGNAPWSAVTDINYGFGAIYSSPDIDMPEEGILTTTAVQAPCWLIENLDLNKVRRLRADGQVLNFKDHQRIAMNLAGGDVEIKRVSIC